MIDDVLESFIRVLKNWKSYSFKLDGYRNFLFLRHDREQKTAINYGSMSRDFMKNTIAGNLELQGKITPHIVLRASCTNMANKKMGLKALPYIMGHSNIMITMNYFTLALSILQE